MRTAVVEYMKLNPCVFSDFVDDRDLVKHSMKMSEPTTWGGGPELVAVEELFDRPVEVYFGDSARGTPLRLCAPEGLPEHVEPLRLAFQGRSLQERKHLVREGLVVARRYLAHPASYFVSLSGGHYDSVQRLDAVYPLGHGPGTTIKDARSLLRYP